MTVKSDLCLQPLPMTDGVPLNCEGYIGWRFAVQIALVTGANVLPFILGTSQLGGPRWVDVTGDIQGLSWGRGGQPAQRPIAGELSFRMLNNDWKWSPWRSPFYGPGTTVRIVVGNGTITKNQFCGQVQSWNEGSVGLDAYSWVDITVWENFYLLSQVNDHALAGVVGGGETLTQRVDRLLTQAAWQYDRDIVSSTPATFQSSDFAQDVATELFRTLDSVDATAWPAKDGMIKIRDRSVGTGAHWTLGHPDLNPDTFVTQNDDERILSSVDLARIGGTFVTYTNLGLASRYDRRSTNRTDLNTVAEGGDADLARVASGVLARARQTYRPISFEVQSGQGEFASELILESDLTDRITIDDGPVAFVNYAICGYQHDVVVTADGVYWIATIMLDIEATSAWYAGTFAPALVGFARVGQSRVGFSYNALVTSPTLTTSTTTKTMG